MGKGLDDRLEEAGSFDLSRLTIVGWLLSLVTTGIMLGVIFVFVAASESPNAKLSKGEIKLYGILALAGAAAFFLGCRWIFERIGIQVVRPLKKKEETAE